MKWCGQWKFVAAMVAVNFALAITNALFKKILDQGASRIIILIYRHAISSVCLTPIAFFRERLEKVNIRSKSGIAKVIGTFVCISGAMVLTLYKGKTVVRPNDQIVNYANKTMSTKKNEKWAIGSAFPIAGAICWSLWFLLQAGIGKAYPCKYSSTAFMSFFSAFQSVIIGLVTERDFTKWILKGELELITVTYAGIVASGLCYVGMSWCVEHRGPVFTSAFTPSVQIFVAMFDFTFLHGHIYFGSIIGSILIVIGLYILLWGRNTEVQEMKQPQVKEENDCDTRSQI